MKYLFHGVIKNKKPILYAKDSFYKYASTFKENQEITITIGKRKKVRTLPQNNYLHGVVFKMIADETGMDIYTVKHEMKDKFAKKTKDGITKIEPTSKMSLERMTEFIKDIKQWSLEFLNVYIPDPDQADGE